MKEEIPLPAGAPYGPLVDIGVNLTDSSFEADRDALIVRARSVGVEHQLVTGTDVRHSIAAAALADSAPAHLSATAGVHPHHAKDVGGDWIRRLRGLLARAGVRAVGETGLDFNRDFSPRDVQEAVFRAQIELAEETALPLFLHERDSAGRFFEVLEPFAGRVRGVLHCFTGTGEDLERALALDLYIGITGWICDERRGERLQHLAAGIPADRLLIETDAPYLLPRTLRPRRKSRRNEPAFLPWVVATLAVCRDESPETVAATSTRNARRLFGF